MRPRSRVYFASREKSDVLLMRASLWALAGATALRAPSWNSPPVTLPPGVRPRALRFAAISETQARSAERITWYAGNRREATRGGALTESGAGAGTARGGRR